MMRIFPLIVLAAPLLLISPQAGAADADRPFAWPNGARAAVSLAYDDALDSQLDNAIPVLDKYGVKGTFYLILSAPSVDKRMAQWRAAARAGHELGNHTLFHQCARSRPDREWVEKHRDLDTVTAEQMKDQIAVANTMLYAIDGKRERTLTAPCGEVKAGGENYLLPIAAEFVAIKAGTSSGIPASMTQLDTHSVPVMAPAGLTGKQLIDRVKEAGAKGTMVNFTFHGIGGDHLTTSSEAHEELVKFLAENKKVYWTDTFLNIMKYVRTARAASSAWVLDWSDEFDGAGLDHGKWVEEVGGNGWGNNELQYYTRRPENVRLADGKLIIEARKEHYENREYTSARIKTAGLKERAYGRYEARMKLPKGQGIWPAFWMLGNDIATKGWPGSGEIDIMENIGKEPAQVHGTLHGPGYSGAKAFGKSSALASGIYADDYHVFAVEWEPKEIRWYRDGILYHTARPELVNGDWVFEHPFFVILNLAVGGDWPGNPDGTTILPQQLLVDYVRVYRRAN